MQQFERTYQRRQMDTTSRWHLLLFLMLSLSSFQPPNFVIATIVLPNSFPSTFVSKQLISNKKLLSGRSCLYDHSCSIDAVTRGGGDSSYNDTTGDEEDSTNNKESNDIPIDTAKDVSLASPTTTISSSTVETTVTTSAVAGTSKDVVNVPPPPPPVTSVVTTDATPSPTNTASTTANGTTSTAMNDIRMTLVTTASMVQNSLNDSRQQFVQTIRTTYQNVQPYVPVNEKYIMTSQHQIMLVAILLAINSGYLNGLGLFGLTTAVIKATSSSASTVVTSTVPTSQAVAAVTSAFTNVGLQLARGNIYTATIPLRLIFSYLMGSFVTGYIVHHTPIQPYEITTYPVSIIFAIGTIALMMVSSILSSNTMTMNIFYLLTFVNGLQNGFTSIYSSNQIRSAHYSGMTSDTGTFLGQYIRSYINHSNHNSNERKKDLLPKIYRNTILSASFIVGGILSYWISQHGGGGSSNANYVVLPSILLYMTFTIVSLLWKPTTITNTASQTSPALQ